MCDLNCEEIQPVMFQWDEESPMFGNSVHKAANPVKAVADVNELPNEVSNEIAQDDHGSIEQNLISENSNISVENKQNAPKELEPSLVKSLK